MDRLPASASVLAVVAHPDDESFGLGAVLSAYADRGVRVSVLCLTRGEASTLHGVEGDLHELRAAELTAAAAELGIDRVSLRDYPDSALADVDLPTLVGEVTDLAAEVGADTLIGFDRTGLTGHPDHMRATEAAVAAGERLRLPVLAWTLPDDVAERLLAEHGVPFVGRAADDIDLVVEVDRTRQLAAVACHPSQAVPGSVLWRRLELSGDREHLAWLRRPAG
ncbi:PIG-L deacetylase family protein [Nocardioides ferulae]|uniref:PIG-L deacetylase family protein n=1 Tax=Nocardioides ferulae TaxID=2340821 RepID=UPI000EB2DA77|nr:PIG-L deacetylase family protein [Nocardioides ferulae]